MTEPTTPSTSRRDFLATTAAAGALAGLGLAPFVHAASDDTLRIGLIGCGGRGTGAAAQALNADKNVKLVALADAFKDRLEGCLSTLKNDGSIAPRIDVPAERCFVGFEAYKQLLACGVDVVLMATPPHFRPAHFAAAVAAGKHCFVEKPVAVDAPGVRSILATCAEAKKKNLSVVSGLCWRYHRGMQETFKRVLGGAVGDITALQCSYNTGPLWKRDRKPEWSDMEWQMRNWLYFTWLSGDFIVEQHIHSLDKMAWAMHDTYPVRASGTGGRQTRTSPAFGHIFDHFAICYEYANGVRLYSYCRQQEGCDHDVTDHIFGTRGICHVLANRGEANITGPNEWTSRGLRAKDDMYQNEHDDFFASIRAGTPINNGEYMANSTMLAILGRMVAYTGKTITWDKALASTEDLSPKSYDWGELPMPAVATPGKTKFA